MGVVLRPELLLVVPKVNIVYTVSGLPDGENMIPSFTLDCPRSEGKGRGSIKGKEGIKSLQLSVAEP